MKRRNAGFSVFELIIVLLILALIVAGGSTLVVEGYRTFMNGQPIIAASGKVNVALDNLLREIKSMQSMVAMGSSSISFVNQEGQTIAISYAGNTVSRSENGGTAYTVCNNITAFTISYFDSTLAATASLASIYFITVAMTYNDGHLLYPITGATALRKFL